MDIDRYIQRNEGTWRRLADLSRQAAGSGRSVQRLSDAEIDELVLLYQRVSAQLSHARTVYADADLNARLSRVLGEARLVIYRRRSNPWTALSNFVTTAFPAAVWHARRFVAVSAACLLLPAIATGVWLSVSGSTLDASIPTELQQVIAERDFAEYYRSDAAQNFAGRVTVNNIYVACTAFALGVLPVLGPAGILALNGLNLGVMAAVMHRAGEGPQFWGLILPHGLLEIAAIIVAGAAGLQISWAIIAPGDRTRSTALREAGLRSVVIILGLVACFATAGFIEGFVTPSDLPTALRVAVGVAAFAAFSVYLVLFGQRAEALGSTGLWGEERRDAIARAEEAAASGATIRA